MEVTPSSSRVSGLMNYDSDVSLTDSESLGQMIVSGYRSIREYLANEPFRPGPMSHHGMRRQQAHASRAAPYPLRAGGLSFNWPSRTNALAASSSVNTAMIWLKHPKRT